MTIRHAFAAALLLVFTGCGQATPDDAEPDAREEEGDQEIEYRTFDYSNQGRACISDDPGYGPLVLVDLETCLSSSCDGRGESSCTATVDGDTLTVTSQAETRSAVGDVECTNDCLPFIIQCTVEGDLADVASITYAGNTTQMVECPPEIRFEE